MDMKKVMEDIYRLLARQILDDYGIKSGLCLEVGLDHGSLGLELLRISDLQLIIAEPDPRLLDAVRKKPGFADFAPRVQLLSTVLTKLPLPDASTDLVISRGALWDWEDKAGVLREIGRVLKPGAVAFVGGGPGRYLPLEERELFTTKREGAQKSAADLEKFRRLRSGEELLRLAQEAGLEDFKLIPDPPGNWLEIRG